MKIDNTAKITILKKFVKQGLLELLLRAGALEKNLSVEQSSMKGIIHDILSMTHFLVKLTLACRSEKRDDIGAAEGWVMTSLW